MVKINDVTIDTLANEILLAINESIFSYHLNGHPKAYGLSIYIGSGGYNPYYDEIKLSELTMWNELIRVINNQPYQAWFYDIWITNIGDEDNDGYWEGFTLNWDVDTLSTSLNIKVNITILNSTLRKIAEYIVGPYEVSLLSSNDTGKLRISLNDGSYIYMSIIVNDQTVYKIKKVLGVSDDVFYIRIETDTFSPNIEITSPSNNTYLSVTDLTVEWSGSDSGSGIDHYEVKLDNAAWVNVGTDTSYTFTSISEGQHVIVVKAVDKAGNEATYRIVIVVDRTNPIISITSPTNGSILEAGTIVVSWRTSDNFEVKSIEVYVNGSRVATLASSDNNYTLNLDAGIYSINVIAIDYAGNKGSSMVIIKVEIAKSGFLSGLTGLATTVSLLLLAIVGLIYYLRRR